MKNTHRFSERQSNLSSQGMEQVGGCGQVTNKPVDLVQLLYLEVLFLFLKNKKHPTTEQG
jgi:hypothetical protein